jgi:hypothetical protein
MSSRLVLAASNRIPEEEEELRVQETPCTLLIS